MSEFLWSLGTEHALARSETITDMNPMVSLVYEAMLSVKDIPITYRVGDIKYTPMEFAQGFLGNFIDWDKRYRTLYVK